MIDVSNLRYYNRGGSYGDRGKDDRTGSADDVARLPYERIERFYPDQPQQSYYGAEGGTYDPYSFDPSGLGGMPPGFFPDEYGMAGDFYQNLMGGGMNVGTPGYWDVGGGVLSDMARSGMPVDIQGYADSLQPVTDRMFRNQAAAAMEKYGLGGVRNSSIAEYGLEDISGRLQENVHMATQQQWLQAQEAARQRQLAATGQLYQYGQGQANLGLANVGNMMGGAQGLMGLGQEYLYAPLNISSQMLGMGNQYQNQQQGMYSTAENDPYLAMLASLAQSNNPQYTQNQYTPGFATQMANLGGSIGPYWNMLFGGGGGGVPTTQPGTPNFGYNDYQTIMDQYTYPQQSYYGG